TAFVITESTFATDQPPSVKPSRVSSSARPGACITPSSVTWLITTTLAIYSQSSNSWCSSSARLPGEAEVIRASCRATSEDRRAVDSEEHSRAPARRGSCTDGRVAITADWPLLTSPRASHARNGSRPSKGRRRQGGDGGSAPRRALPGELSLRHGSVIGKRC